MYESRRPSQLGSKGEARHPNIYRFKGHFHFKTLWQLRPPPSRIRPYHLQTHQNEYMKLSVTVRCVDRVARVLYFQGRDV